MNSGTYLTSFRKTISIMETFCIDHPLNENFREDLLRMYKANHLDPDGKAVREAAGIKCTADGLLSIKRICDLEYETKNIIPTYKRYREIPIFFFPRENGGINTSRSVILGDRIDHTLFDIRKYYMGDKQECLLKRAFERPKTDLWLNSMGSFESLVEWLGIKGVFTDNNYEVYDLESSENALITDYKTSAEYHRQWTIEYYENIKKKIDMLCSG